MDFRQLLACFIVLVAGLYLLQQQSTSFRKAGMAMIWAASGLCAYFLTGSAPMAGLMLAAWVFFPLWEMVFVLRQLRVPRHRELTDARAPRADMEELMRLSGELRDLGFSQLDECRIEPAQHEQFYRLFLDGPGRTQAVIGYLAQGSIGFHFVIFTSVGPDGRRWVTWDYPLTYGLVMPPEIAVYRALHCETVAELRQAHLDFLGINGVALDALAVLEETPAAARARLEQTLNRQVEYNIARGFLAPAVDAENFCYSWRGTIYVAGQVLRDLIF